MQVSPRIWKVAVPRPQHSAMFGQRASSQIVFRRGAVDQLADVEVRGVRARRPHLHPLGAARPLGHGQRSLHGLESRDGAGLAVFPGIQIDVVDLEGRARADGREAEGDRLRCRAGSSRCRARASTCGDGAQRAVARSMVPPSRIVSRPPSRLGTITCTCTGRVARADVLGEQAQVPVAEREARPCRSYAELPAGRSREWLSRGMTDVERLVAGDHPRAAAHDPSRLPPSKPPLSRARTARSRRRAFGRPRGRTARRAAPAARARVAARAARGARRGEARRPVRRVRELG